MNRTILAAISGAALACALILSCSDDSPSNADAQVACDCPAAEAPLSGRVVHVTQTVALPAEDAASTTAFCAEGGLLLGGGCNLEAGNSRITLARAATNQEPQAFTCDWNNTTFTPNSGVATAICLMPAPAN